MHRSSRLAVAALAIALAVPASQALAQPQRTDGAAEAGKSLADIEAEVAKLSAELPTLSGSVADLTARLERITQALETLRRQQKSVPETVDAVDRLTLRVEELRADVEQLRTELGNVRSPAVAAGSEGGGVSYEDGFRWSSADGVYGLHLGGLMQFRAYGSVAEDDTGDLSDVEDGFAFRRTRFFIGGHASHVEFFMLADPRLDHALLDYWLRLPLWHHGDAVNLSLKVGQDRATFTRMFITWAPSYVFPDRPLVIDAFRYDRSPGVGVEGTFLGNHLYAYLGATNGAGRGRINDNEDVAAFARVEASLLGPRPDYTYGDVAHREKPVIVLGAGLVHDLVRVPQDIAGVEVGDRDVDGDGDIDNVRVLSVSADLLVRWLGFELDVEGVYRHEDWGSFFDQPDNTDVGDLFEFDGSRNYLGIYGDLSYVCGSWIFGGRLGHHRQPPLLLDGRSLAAPPLSKRLVEASGVVRWMHDDHRVLGLQYTYLNQNNGDATEVPNDEEHRIFAELQLLF